MTFGTSATVCEYQKETLRALSWPVRPANRSFSRAAAQPGAQRRQQAAHATGYGVWAERSCSTQMPFSHTAINGSGAHSHIVGVLTGQCAHLSARW